MDRKNGENTIQIKLQSIPEHLLTLNFDKNKNKNKNILIKIHLFIDIITYVR